MIAEFRAARPNDSKGAWMIGLEFQCALAISNRFFVASAEGRTNSGEGITESGEGIQVNTSPQFVIGFVELAHKPEEEAQIGVKHRNSWRNLHGLSQTAFGISPRL